MRLSAQYLLAYLALVQVTHALLFPRFPGLTLSYSLSKGQRAHQISSKVLFRVRDRIIERIWPTNLGTDVSLESIQSSDGSRNLSKEVLARYGEDFVLRFTFQSSQELQALASATRVLFLDVWESSTRWADIRLAKQTLPLLLGLLPTSMQHSFKQLPMNLAQAIDKTYSSPIEKKPARQAGQRLDQVNSRAQNQPDERNIFFREYQPLRVIEPWMQLLRSLFPSHTRLVSIGTSYEGRNIPAFRVGVHPTNDAQVAEPRKTIVVVGGAHAREWISTSTVTYVAYAFITSYGRSKEITKLLEKFDFVFIPTINPDGYVYTWDTDRLWRKNRQPTDIPFCPGIDLDRAYGYEWDGLPPNNNPCAEFFPGNAPFEAVEARQLVSWIRNETTLNNVVISGFLDLHSYAQQVLYPYSFSCEKMPHSLETLEELAIGLAKAIHSVNGEVYSVTSACEGSTAVDATAARPNPKGATPQTNTERTLETGGGSALDYFYSEFKVPYTYQLKLRDTGTYGFLLPSEHIIPTGREVFRAVEYFGNFLAGNHGIESEAGIHDGIDLTVSKVEQKDDVSMLNELNAEL